MDKKFIRRTVLGWGAAIVCVTGVSATAPSGYRDINAFVDGIAKEGVSSAALTQMLSGRGTTLLPIADSRGTLRASDVSLDDGTSLKTIWVTPDTGTQMGAVDVAVSTDKCVKAEPLRVTYRLNEVPVVMTAPAPSNSPNTGPVPLAHAVEGRVGKVTLRLTYFSVVGRPVNENCVFSLSLK